MRSKKIYTRYSKKKRKIYKKRKLSRRKKVKKRNKSKKLYGGGTSPPLTKKQLEEEEEAEKQRLKHLESIEIEKKLEALNNAKIKFKEKIASFNETEQNTNSFVERYRCFFNETEINNFYDLIRKINNELLQFYEAELDGINISSNIQQIKQEIEVIKDKFKDPLNKKLTYLYNIKLNAILKCTENAKSEVLEAKNIAELKLTEFIGLKTKELTKTDYISGIKKEVLGINIVENIKKQAEILEKLAVEANLAIEDAEQLLEETNLTIEDAETLKIQYTVEQIKKYAIDVIREAEKAKAKAKQAEIKLNEILKTLQIQDKSGLVEAEKEAEKQVKNFDKTFQNEVKKSINSWDSLSWLEKLKAYNMEKRRKRGEKKNNKN